MASGHVNRTYRGRTHGRTDQYCTREESPCQFGAVLTGKAVEAVPMLTSGLTALRSTGAILHLPWFLLSLTRAYGELGLFDSAWRSIGEAMTTVETTKERWLEAEVYRTGGEIALRLAQSGCSQSRSLLRARARSRPPTTSQSPGNSAPQ